MFRLVSAMVLALGVSSQALATEENYYKIKDMSVTEVPVESLHFANDNQVMGNAGFAQDCNNTVPKKETMALNPLEELSPITTLEIYLDQIINLGKKVWAIVELGKPVSNVNVDIATALPKGLKCWTDLAGWQAPQAKAYKVEYKNLYGMTVVSYTYRVVATAGGSLNGAGKYITNATFQPASIYVAWGFKFNANASVNDPFNMGSTNDPIAGLQLNMKWDVDSPLAHIENTDSFHVSGANVMQKL